MVIAKGETWGEPAPDAEPIAVVTDQDLAAAALAAWEVGKVLEATVGPGDVRTQLGVPEPRTPAERHRYPFDLGLVTVGGRRLGFVGHVLARRRAWRGEFAVVMNTGWSGPWYLGPRAHPNDALLDITVGRLAWRQRLAARRRVATGSHLPHPDLTTLRRRAWNHRFPHPVRVLVDGQDQGPTSTVEVEVIPDALVVVV